MKRRAADQKDVSWNDALNRFMSHLEHEERSTHTTNRYRNGLSDFAKWWERTSTKPLTVARVSPVDVRIWRDYLRTEPIDKNGRTRKPASINAKLSALKSLLQWAKHAKIITELPDLPRREHLAAKAVKSLDKRQQQRLLRQAAAQRNPRNLPMVEVLLGTGLRVAELVALRWADVPFSDRKGTVKVTLGKGRKPRDIPMSPEVLRALRNLRELDPDSGSTSPVFASQRFDPKNPDRRKALSSRGVQVLLAKLGEALGWEEPLHPHMLRHTFAMNLVRKGVPFPVIAKLMGHSSILTTMTHYGTPNEGDLRKAVDPNGEEE